MTRSKTAAVLMALVAAHIFLAALFATQTPYRTAGMVLSGGGYAKDIGAPDERQHANYIGRLLRGEGLPVFSPQDPNLYEDYQAHQPPLYYGIAAGWHKALQAVGVARVVTDQLPVETTRPGETRRSFEVRALQIPDGFPTRFLNCLIGGLTVAGVYFLSLWGYRKEGVALTAAAFAALLPMHLALSGAISNDPLLICLCTWTLAVLALSLREGWTLKRAVAVGLLAGLAILTKSTAVALLPILLLALFVPQKSKPGVPMIGTAAGVVALLAVPWWARNVSHYGDPLAMKAFTQAFVGSAQHSLLVDKVIPATQPGANPEFAYWIDWVGYWTARSFFGVFGYMDIWLTQSGRRGGSFDSDRVYWVLIALLVVAAVGWCLSWREPDAKESRSVRILGLAFAAIVLLLFLRFNMQYFQAQARYLFPAIGPIAAGVAVGLHTLLKRWPAAPLVVVVLMFAAVDVLSLTRLGPQFDQRIELGKLYKQQHPEA